MIVCVMLVLESEMIDVDEYATIGDQDDFDRTIYRILGC